MTPSPSRLPSGIRVLFLLALSAGATPLPAAPQAATDGARCNAGSPLDDASPQRKPQREKAAPAVRAVPTEIGFSSGSQIFQAGPGTRTELEGDAMRWSIEYRSGEQALASRAIDARVPQTARRMRLRHRSDRDGPIVLRLEEEGGVAWLVQIEPGREWKELELGLSGLQAAPGRRGDGWLKPGALARLTIIDAAARDRQAQGTRRIWLAGWVID